MHAQVWFGCGGTVTSLHFDGYDNFLCQVSSQCSFLCEVNSAISLPGRQRESRHSVLQCT